MNLYSGIKMRSIFLITIIILLTTFNLHGQWEVLNEGFKGTVNSVDFINMNIGWMVSDEGILLNTVDRGRNWQSIPLSEDLSVYRLEFISEMNGWAIGNVSEIEGKVVLKTENAGYSWEIKNQKIGVWVNSLQVVDDTVVFVGGDSKISYSRNDGLEWVDISPDIVNGFFNSVSFKNQTEGIVCGEILNGDHYNGIIYKTSNRGTTWESKIFNEFYKISKFQFGKNFEGYFLAENFDVQPEYFFCRTNDLGQTWDVLYESNFPINSYFLSDFGSLYISVSDSFNNKILLKSLDSGKNWQEIISNRNWQTAYLILDEEDNGIIISQLVGDGGFQSDQIIINTRMENNNWSTQRFSYSLSDINFVEQQRGFTVGGYSVFHGPTGGDIFSTLDGGQTWFLESSIPGWINSIEFADDSIGYLMTQDWPWLISKTNNIGSSWNVVFENNYDSAGFEFYGNDLFLSSREKVWIAGSYWSEDSDGAAVLFTSDGGLNWELFWTYPNSEGSWYNLYSIFEVDNIVWLVGESGFIVRLIDREISNIITYPTDLPLNEVFFSDAKHGWIAGGYGYNVVFQPLFLKTIDGGTTWKESRELPYVINDIFFRDSLQGWAVGFDSNQEGVIVATNNGGESWYPQAEKLSSVLNAIHFMGDYGWAVGENGLLLKTENAGANWIDDRNDNTYVSTFRLDQNYPNPFNPKTIINYELPITNEVELSIYNLLGQKVVTLVSGKQPAGYYQVEWDASGYASGVYIYRLSAKGKTQSVVRTKKLVLLK